MRKDCLEIFRQIFQHLEEEGTLDMTNRRHRACLYLVYHARIQASLDRAKEAWNNHRIRTAGNRSPLALYELSRTRAINAGYWRTDAGDTAQEAGLEGYGVDPEPCGADMHDQLPGSTGQGEINHRSASLASDAELDVVSLLLAGLDLQADDGAWGTQVFHTAVRELDRLLMSVSIDQ